MMCLGKHWDPETSTYSGERPSDGAKPPLIPDEFHDLVKRAIKDSHAYLEKHCKKRDVEDILPSMSPNICIVNFYTKSGRLGLHQVPHLSALFFILLNVLHNYTIILKTVIILVAINTIKCAYISWFMINYDSIFQII